MGRIKGIPGYGVEVDKTLKEVNPDDYEVLILKNKPVLAISHGPQTLITAGLLNGKYATCYRSMAQEMKDAGAIYRVESE